MVGAAAGASGPPRAAASVAARIAAFATVHAGAHQHQQRGIGLHDADHHRAAATPIRAVAAAPTVATVAPRSAIPAGAVARRIAATAPSCPVAPTSPTPAVTAAAASRHQIHESRVAHLEASADALASPLWASRVAFDSSDAPAVVAQHDVDAPSALAALGRPGVFPTTSISPRGHA